MSKEKSVYNFNYANDEEYRLLLHVIAKITNTERVMIYKNRKTGRVLKKIGIDCTVAQAAEIGKMFWDYKDAWREEKEVLLGEFLVKCDLFEK